MRHILPGELQGDVQLRPLYPQGGVVKAHSPVCRGAIAVVALVAKERIILQHNESMRKAARNKKLPAVLRTEFYRHVLPVCPGPFAQIHDHIPHGASCHAHKLGLRMRSGLPMKATDDASGRKAFVVLHKRGVNAGGAVALKAVHFAKPAAAVAEPVRLDYLDAFYFSTDDFHVYSRIIPFQTHFVFLADAPSGDYPLFFQNQKSRISAMHLLELLFAVPIAAIGLAAAIHATAYIHGEERKHAPRFWGFFVSTLLSMAAVILAGGLFEVWSLGFLVAWEAMALSSAGLVAFDSTKKSVRKATWIYLLACHAGVAALLLAFKATDAWSLAFFLAVIGFGLKIGFPPFHSWLPEAHPAAPAPASAVMSGAMIPLGFYGLLKFLFGTAGAEILTAGWTFLVLGAIGAVGGILFAMAQSNLKKLLAFSSVENMGIIAIGIGLGCLSSETKHISALCIGGALVHVLNHAFLKGALFLGAGSILRQTGTLDLDRMGGLMRRMPFTGTLFTLNAIGLAGLPPFNGFIGELAIYIGAFAMIATGNTALVIAGFVAAVALALSGGLAVAAYAKAIGGALLGLPRSREAAEATETPHRMWIAMALLTLLSVAMIPASICFLHYYADAYATATLTGAAIAGGALAALTIALLLLRRFACPRGGIVAKSPTWDCGYHAPTARMAYTATAITQPLVDFFRRALRTRKYLIPFKGAPENPTDAAIATETADAALASFWRPAFTAAARLFQRAHLLQNGSLHLYILIVILAVLTLLAFALAS